MSRRANTWLRSRLEAELPPCDGSTGPALGLGAGIPAPKEDGSVKITSQVLQGQRSKLGGDRAASQLGTTDVSKVSGLHRLEARLHAAVRPDAQALSSTGIEDLSSTCVAASAPKAPGTLLTKLKLIRLAKADPAKPLPTSTTEADVVDAFLMVQTAVEVGASSELVQTLLTKAQNMAIQTYEDAASESSSFAAEPPSPDFDESSLPCFQILEELVSSSAAPAELVQALGIAKIKCLSASPLHLHRSSSQHHCPRHRTCPRHRSRSRTRPRPRPRNRNRNRLVLDYNLKLISTSHSVDARGAQGSQAAHTSSSST